MTVATGGGLPRVRARARGRKRDAFASGLPATRPNHDRCIEGVGTFRRVTPLRACAR